jgi:DNA repair exonuclease SbcCD nuclease subunit
MKFAFTADLHLSRYGQDPINEMTGLPDRLHSIMQALRNIADHCVKNDIGVMVIGGDIMHNKSIIYSLAQKLLLDFLEDYRQLKFWVVTGNHDLSHKGKDAISALEFLDHHDSVEINATHGMCGSIAKIDAGPSILIVPYSSDMAVTIKKAKANILISHFGLNEAVVNSGLSIISDISIRHLENNYDLVLLGHYHKPQEVSNENVRIFYAGSPIQLDWGEKDDEKRFLVVDSETLEVESIPTSGYRKHVQLDLTKKNIKETIQKAERLRQEGHLVKIIKKETIDTDKLEKEFIIVDRTDKDITDRGLSSSMTDEEILRRYLAGQEIPEEEHDEYIEFIRKLEGEDNERHNLSAG